MEDPFSLVAFSLVGNSSRVQRSIYIYASVGASRKQYRVQKRSYALPCRFYLFMGMNIDRTIAPFVVYICHIFLCECDLLKKGIQGRCTSCARIRVRVLFPSRDSS